MGLSRDQYFVVQQIYRGWSLLGGLLLVEFVSLIAVVLYARADKRMRNAALVALLCLVGAQLLFWVFTYPANAATENWTVQPENWRELQQRWEFSHAGGAVLQNRGTITASGTLYLGNGQSFTLFSAATPSGNFASIAGTPAPGLAWSFNPASGVLTVTNAQNSDVSFVARSVAVALTAVPAVSPARPFAKVP